PHAALVVGAWAVHLIYECNSRHPVLVGLAPYRFRLRFNATDGTKNGNGAIQHAQGAFNFGSEINVTGSINNVDTVIVPETCRRGGRNRDSALLFLFHPVHRGGAFMHLTDLVVDAGVVE